jgi:regulatory protein
MSNLQDIELDLGDLGDKKAEQKAKEITKIRRSVLNWLARRDYSQHEIIQKLKAKPYSKTCSKTCSKTYSLAAIQSVVADLAQNGLINEQRFTENYVRWRQGKGFGPLRIQAELQARGIPAEMIAEQLDITDNAWFLQAKRMREKHFKGSLPNEFKLRAKQMRFLQYRGFTKEQIEDVFGSDY